jgi:nickel/cobalt transporter (NicO) family protein
MTDALIYLVSAFWIGAVHAATPGHGKTIAAAYIVGARGRPVDAVILGIFVTLSHTSGIVLVGILASIGLPGMVPQRIEAWMALITGLLVILIGLWTLWTQRELILQLQGIPLTPATEPDHSHDQAAMHFRPHTHDDVQGHAHLRHGHEHAHGAAHGHSHDHSHRSDHTHAVHHGHGDDHDHGDHRKRDEEASYHSHGWGFKHTHDLKLATTNRPGLWVLIGLGVAGGLLPDPAALAILLNALAQGKVMLGLGTVVVFSVGFAATLVIVGVVAAKVGQKILDWLAGPWAMRLQVGTSLLIVVVGAILSFGAWRTLSSLA